MNFRLARPGSVVILVMLLAASASAQRGAGAGSVGAGGPPLGPSQAPMELPSDASITSQGGLLVDVAGENRTPLDRQAVVKAYNKENENVVYQTTGREAEAALGALSPGAYELEVSAVGYLTTTTDVKISSAHSVYRLHIDLKKDPSA